MTSVNRPTTTNIPPVVGSAACFRGSGHRRLVELTPVASTRRPVLASIDRYMLLPRFAIGFAVIGSLMAQSPPSSVRYTDVPFVPTAEKLVDAMLDLAGIKAGDVLMDLGSGDGRIVNQAARRFGIRAIGVEIIPDLVAQSERNARQLGVQDKVRFIQGDLFEQDLRQVTVVTVFLTPSVNLRLRPKLLKELKPGSRVVARTFGFGNWKPAKTIDVDDTPLSLWVIPREQR
jgi:precorrin-6B methylase 2